MYTPEEIQDHIARVVAIPARDSTPILASKPVESRKHRPVWAQDDKSLLRQLIATDGKFSRRLQIAFLYWRENRSAQSIADDLGVSLWAVKSAIKRCMAK